MKPTEQEIIAIAKSKYFRCYSGFISEQIELDRNRNTKITSFVEGFNEAISQMQPEWVSVDDGLPEIGAQCYFYRMGISDFVYTGKYNGLDQWGSTYFKEEDKPAYYRDVTHYSVFSKPQPPIK